MLFMLLLYRLRPEDTQVDDVLIPIRPAAIMWQYDEEADVLYLSVGGPRSAVGVDIGDGLVVRYDEARRDVTGLTVIGLRKRLMRGLNPTE